MQLDLNLYPLLLLASLPASNVHLVHNVHHFLKLYYFFLDDDSVFYLFSLLLQNHVFQINASCCICFLSILTTSQPGMSRQASFVKVKFRRKNMTNGVTTTPWRIPPVLPLLLIPTTNAKPVALLSSNILLGANGCVVPQILYFLYSGNVLLNRIQQLSNFKPRKKVLLKTSFSKTFSIGLNFKTTR